MTKRHRVILTGGGTGGHVYPALAVAEQLKKNSDVEAIVYIGVQGHLEEKLAKENNIDFVGLKSNWPATQNFQPNFKISLAAEQSCLASPEIIKSFKPTVVLGTGGYAAAPALSAAVLKQIPIVIHEPDSYPGLVNKMFAIQARLVSLGMAAAQARFKRLGAKKKIVLNGNPISERFLHLPNKTAACESLGLDPMLPVILSYRGLARSSSTQPSNLWPAAAADHQGKRSGCFSNFTSGGRKKLVGYGNYS